jgi:hypothetical protein
LALLGGEVKERLGPHDTRSVVLAHKGARQSAQWSDDRISTSDVETQARSCVRTRQREQALQRDRAREAGTKEKDIAALSLLVNRAVPVRKGVPVNFKTRPLSNPTECAEAFGDILAAIGRGELTPDEGNMIGALIERRANLFQTVELQDEIAALKAQIAKLVVPPPRPALHVVERP